MCAGGVEAFYAPKSAWYKPEYVVVLETHDDEKATLAASVATASQANGRKTALVLMSTSPLLFRKQDVAKEGFKHYTEVNVSTM